MSIKFIIALLFSFSAVSLANAAPGELDTTFGTGGKTVLTTINGVSALPSRIAIQTDGKIIFAGNNNTGITIELIVARFNTDGTPDTSFGSGGVTRFGFGDLLSAASDVAIQPDGKIVVVGIASANFGGDANFAVARLNSNGSLDNTFDGDGRVTTTFDGNLLEAAFGVALQTDGKIVVAGSRQDSATQEGWFAVARYNSNGSLDNTFDGDGRLFTKAGINNELSNFANAVVLQTDGKIVVAGETSSATTSQFALLRLTTNGALDTTFDGDGKVQTVITGFGTETANTVTIQSDGKIIAAGNADTDPNSGGGNDDFAVVRYNANGSPDTSFGGDGKETFSFGNTLNFEQAYSVIAQSNNQILVGGLSGVVAAENVVASDFAVIKLNSNGTPDTNFGIGGFVKTPFSEPLSLGYKLLLQADGKIVFGGISGNGPIDEADFSPAIVRYSNDNAVSFKSPFDFDGDGKTDIGIFRPSAGEWWISRSSTGVTVAAQFGASSDKPVPADFTGDGKTDIAFWRPSTGEWFILRSENGSFLSFSFGTTGDVPIVGDFDADGKSDAGVFRPSTNEWFIQKSSGGTIITTFGTAGDVPVTADYDGDGKTDIAIYRPSLGQWWLNRSTAGVVVAAFGTSTDKPVQGDYSGDGKADIAFWRPSSGEWFILRSEDASFYSVPFGASGDIAAAGDYDGDGKFDTAVFRPSTNTWFVNRSTSGLLITNFGTTGDQPLPSVFIP